MSNGWLEAIVLLLGAIASLCAYSTYLMAKEAREDRNRLPEDVKDRISFLESELEDAYARIYKAYGARTDKEDGRDRAV
jgi:hypothetical protein